MTEQHRVIVAQDNRTERVLVTYIGTDGIVTTERVSEHLRDVLRSAGLLTEQTEEDRPAPQRGPLSRRPL